MDALQRVNDQNIELVITDLNMPNMDGISLITHLRNQALHKHLPILLFSTESPETKTKAMEAGATGMLEKPMERKAMLSYIKRLVR